MSDSKKEIYQLLEKHLIEDEKPSEFFNNSLNKDKLFNIYPFSLLKDLFSIEQSPTHHPEGNVWNHVMLVIDNAAQRRHMADDKVSLMWAALLHDLGKIKTTRTIKGRITAYDHDRVGQKMCSEFLEDYDMEEKKKQYISKLVRWHMQLLYFLKKLPFENIKEMIKEVSINDISILVFSDRLGRGKIKEEEIKNEEKNVENFINACRNIINKQ